MHDVSSRLIGCQPASNVHIPTADPVADPAQHAVRRGEALLHACALAAALVVAAVTAHQARWELSSLLLLIALTTVSDLMSVATGATTLEVSGSFLGLILPPRSCSAAALPPRSGCSRSRSDGSAPARHRITSEQPRDVRMVPARRRAALPCVARAARLDSGEIGYYLLVFAMFVLALGPQLPDGGRLPVLSGRCPRSGRSSREAFAPLLSSELFSALLTMAAVYVAVHLDRDPGSACSADLLVVFQYLAGELLTSQRRRSSCSGCATTDALTGLAEPRAVPHPDRAGDRATASAVDGASAMLLIDLDGFKEINDTLGHDYGDSLLQDLGPRLARCVGPSGRRRPARRRRIRGPPGNATDDREPCSSSVAAPAARVRPAAVRRRRAVARGGREHRDRALSG